MYFYYFTNIINELTKRIVYQLNKSRAFWSNKYLHLNIIQLIVEKLISQSQTRLWLRTSILSI